MTKMLFAGSNYKVLKVCKKILYGDIKGDVKQQEKMKLVNVS